MHRFLTAKKIVVITSQIRGYICSKSRLLPDIKQNRIIIGAQKRLFLKIFKSSRMSSAFKKSQKAAARPHRERAQPGFRKE